MEYTFQTSGTRNSNEFTNIKNRRDFTDAFLAEVEGVNLRNSRTFSVLHSHQIYLHSSSGCCGTERAKQNRVLVLRSHQQQQ